MMRIQDLATIELLPMDHRMIHRIKGGMVFSFLETSMTTETTTTEGITWNSLYTVLENGFSSITTVSMVSTTPGSSVSLISSNTMVSIA